MGELESVGPSQSQGVAEFMSVGADLEALGKPVDN
jgi:hypothetical protein